MFLTFSQLRALLRQIISNKREQGHVTEGLDDRLEQLPDSYDALYDFAYQLAKLPMRDDWPHTEPSDWEGIEAEMDSSRPRGQIRPVNLGDAATRAEAAFYGSVVGCTLGKPLEIMPTLAELREAAKRIGEWPFNDYVSVRIFDEGGLRDKHGSWSSACRDHITFVPPDDDVNYTILGMLMLEQHGDDFGDEQLRRMWLNQLTPGATWGPERTVLAKAAVDSLRREALSAWAGDRKGADGERPPFAEVLNPGDELCGAMIRADAYGYACPGDPGRAAKLAWRDAHWTHRRTGIYGTMFAAAAIAAAPVTKTPLEIFETALQFVPQRSRFASVITDSLEMVADAPDWQAGYDRIYAKYQQYGHCKVFQESATLINTLRFAENVGHGVCLQVMQGNDTDSYGATAGSILGAWFGPGHLESRWVEPFNDDLRTSLAGFHERSLSAVAKRVGQLPGRLSSVGSA